MQTINAPIRMTTGPARRATLAALMSAVALVACGGGDSDDPTPPPPAPSVSASVCFNASAYAVGSTSVLDYSRSGASVGTVRISNTVTRQTTFAGSDALEQVSDSTFNPPAGSVSATNVKTYSTALTATGITQYGVDSTTNLSGLLAGAFSFATTNYSPPWIDKTPLLTAGESYTVVLNGTTTSSNLFPGTPVRLITSTTSTTRTVKFVGLESVTVPAGTFAGACKFETTTTTGNTPATAADTSTRWVTAGSGVSVKQISGSGSSELTQVLTSGTVNGVAVR